MTDWFKVLEPKLSDGQKAFFSNKENLERLINICSEPDLIKMYKDNDVKLSPEYQKCKKKYEKAAAIYGIIDDNKKLMKQSNKDNKEIESIDKSISYFKEQILIQENHIKNAEQHIAMLKNKIVKKEEDKKDIQKKSNNLDPVDLPREVSRAKYDLDQVAKSYFENRYILDAIALIKNHKETRTTKTTTVVEETVTTTVIKRKNSIVSVHSKKTVSTVHTDDYITSDTEYNGDSESITSSLIDRRQERSDRRNKRSEKRVFRINENEALKKRGLPEKSLSFDPENIDAN